MKMISRLVSISFPVEATATLAWAFKSRTGEQPNEFRRFTESGFDAGDISGEALANSWLAGRLLVSAPRLLALEICCAAPGYFCPHEGTAFMRFLDFQTYTLDDAMALQREAEAATKASRAHLAQLVSWARSKEPTL